MGQRHSVRRAMRLNRLPCEPGEVNLHARIRGGGDARKRVPHRDRSLGEGDQAADRNSRLRILVRSSTRLILGISSRSTAV